MSRIDSFLELAVKQGGSDLHLVSGQSPRIRIGGTLHRVRFRELSVEDLDRMLAEVMTDGHREVLDDKLAVDFAYQAPGIGRFRANVYRHVRGTAVALRHVPDEAPSLEALGMPSVVRSMISQPRGLTLVTGPTGSGKTTTLAAMLDHINRTRRAHIVTIEDPIEFVHPSRGCVITQREIGMHSPSFTVALRDAIREDPDVILVGEMRDMETISLALTAAETGAQVLGTLHTSGAPKTVDRILNVFPARRQDQIRTMLAESLTLLVSQQLVRVSGEGNRRRAAVEILVNTPAAASVIRAGSSHKLLSVIQAGAKVGMQSLDAVLKDLVHKGSISAQEAFEKAVDRAQFERLVTREEAA
jgi:twitching motility protein PilT